MTTKQRSRLIAGLLLILAGALFIAMRLYPALGERMADWVAWPIYVIGAGVLMFVLGLLAGSPGMAVPACVVAGIGGLLYYQYATNDWASWRYAWTLIVGFVGVGVVVEGLFKGRTAMGLRDGAWLLAISGALFLIFSSVTGGPFTLGVYWPLLLILIGLWLMIGALVGRHRRRDNFFWGLMVALLGVMFQADTLGYFPNVDVWAVFVALFLISLGGWLVIRGIWRRKAVEEPVSVPLGGATRGALVLRHAAGKLEFGSAALDELLVEGVCSGGASVRTLRVGEMLEAELTTRKDNVVLGGDHEVLDWRLKANRAVPYDRLELHGGASEGVLDLSELRIDEIMIKTGASTTRVTAPAVGQTRLGADVGAAMLHVIVPDGVAASIRSKGGLFTLDVDEKRFPRQGERYVSPGYEAAANRLEVEVTAGLGTVKVE